MGAPVKPTEVKVFLEARTKESLVQKMLENNLKHGKKFVYDIMRDGQGYVAWYEHDFELEMLKQISKPKKAVTDVDEDR